MSTSSSTTHPEDPGAGRIIVLRYGELFLKGANRGRFEKALRQNIHRALASLEGVSLERGQGRLFVTCEEGQEQQACQRCSRVFGLSSLSLGWAVPPDMEAITESALVQVRRLLRDRTPQSFRVSARRSDKSFPINSPEINRRLGASIVEETGLSVDLSSPGLVVGVEIGPVQSFIYVDRIPGAGGLPVGVSGRVALLLSGGIDSPVAGHLMQKRGCTLTAVYFHSFPFTGERTRDKVCRLAGKLAPAQGALPLHVVHFTDIQKQIRDHAPSEMAVILYRRSMMRIASALARQRRCHALASGENLGQVASQTLENIGCIEDAAALPVLRPLLTFDKAETIQLARDIHTYDISIEPYEDCCSLFVPRHPLTRCQPGTARQAEERLSLAPLEEEALHKAEEVVLEG